MNEKRTKIFYGLIIIVIVLFITNTIMIMQIKSGIASSNYNTKKSSIEVSDDTTKVVKKVYDSVVTIAIYQNDQLVSNGSGSIISYKGNKAKIVTNNHVIDAPKGSVIKVIFSNKKEIQAKILGSDSISDLALLEVTTDFKVTPIAIGDSEALQQGESVIAIGSPLNAEFSGTVTKGVISGLNRSIETENNSIMQVLQTDTTINPGNSGGPLINMAGQLIGINTSKISLTGFEGMGFAIPSNEAVNILEQLEKYGKIERPSLGISYQAISSIPEYMLERFNIPKNISDGIYIVEVAKNSSASRAGLKPDDIIVKVNNEEIKRASVFTTKLYASKKGDKLKLDVYRDGKLIKIVVTL